MARFSGCPAATPMAPHRLQPAMSRPFPLSGAAVALAFACLLAAPATAAAALTPPRAETLSRGWEMRSEQAAPAEPQPPPPEESAPAAAASKGPAVVAKASRAGPYRPAKVPGVFDF